MFAHERPTLAEESRGTPCESVGDRLNAQILGDGVENHVSHRNSDGGVFVRSEGFPKSRQLSSESRKIGDLIHDIIIIVLAHAQYGIESQARSCADQDQMDLDADWCRHLSILSTVVDLTEIECQLRLWFDSGFSSQQGSLRQSVRKMRWMATMPPHAVVLRHQRTLSPVG